MCMAVFHVQITSTSILLCNMTKPPQHRFEIHKMDKTGSKHNDTRITFYL